MFIILLIILSWLTTYINIQQILYQLLNVRSRLQQLCCIHLPQCPTLTTATRRALIRTNHNKWNTIIELHMHTGNYIALKHWYLRSNEQCKRLVRNGFHLAGHNVLCYNYKLKSFCFQYKSHHDMSSPKCWIHNTRIIVECYEYHFNNNIYLCLVFSDLCIYIAMYTLHQ